MTAWMHKHGQVACLSAALAVCLMLVVGVLLPSMQTCDALNKDIQQQASHLALLQSRAKTAVFSPRVGPLFSGPDALLRAARRVGITALSVNALKDEGYQLSGEASVSALAAWLQVLAQTHQGLSLASVDLSVQNNGRVHFVFTAVQTGEFEGAVASAAWPIGNPFCHVASLNEALVQATVPLIRRYPLSDIHWVGQAVLNHQAYVFLALPGGVTVSAKVGDVVSEVQASIVNISVNKLQLRLPNGRNFILKQERGS